MPRVAQDLTRVLEALLLALVGASAEGAPAPRPCRLSRALCPASCLLCSISASTCPSCAGKETPSAYQPLAH